MTRKSVVVGMAAGLVGVAAMTAAEKVEQVFTHRPNSYVPAHTLERLLRLPHKPDAHRRGLNWAMHWGQGIVLGAVRGLMAERGLRGPTGSFLFLNMRLLNDQSLENATGVGAPPWTWPVDEQVIDLLHKAIYAYATGSSLTGSSLDLRVSPRRAGPGKRANLNGISRWRFPPIRPAQGAGRPGTASGLGSMRRGSTRMRAHPRRGSPIAGFRSGDKSVDVYER